MNAAIKALERRPEVKYAEPNFVYSTTATPDDPRIDELWGLHNTGQTIGGRTGTPDADIDAPEAWDSVTGDPAVTVAVVDTGVASDHPDLAANMWTNSAESANGIDDDGNGYVDDVRGWDWSDDDNTAQDLNGHGTHVAGTIGAVGNDGTGIAGVAWDVSIMPLRALDAAGSGTTADIISAFAYASAEGADVVNASLGGPGYSQALSDVIAGATQTLFVVAAGNSAADNETAASYPCNYPATNLICVAATDNQDRLASFSNYGKTAVDLGAPGVRVLSTVPSQTTVMSEGFDNPVLGARWTTGGTASWDIESDGFGPFASDSPSRNYAANADSWMRTSSALDLTGKRGCTVGFWLNLDTEQGYDPFTVEASTDATTWTQLGGWWGSSGSWRRMEESLGRFDGADSVYLRFRLQSDAAIESNGAGVDDVAVECMGGPFQGNEYGYLDGTSMATPQVAGAAALLLARAPDASASSVRSAILSGVDATASLAGTTVTGGRLNVKQALDQLMPKLRFSKGSFSVSEDGGSATVTVQRIGDPSLPVGVNYASSTGTATAGSDYTTVSGTLAFAAGQSTATFTVPITDDAAVENDETLALVLSAPTGGAVLGDLTTASLTITDDEAPAVVSFQSATQTVAENSGVVGLTVTRSGNTALPASVDYRRASGTADPEADFDLAPGTLSFAPGETTKTISVTVSNDIAPEAAETIEVALTSTQAETTVGTPGSTRLTIAASDQRPDALISTARTSGYIGNDIYNTTGSGQTKTLEARRAETRTFYVQVFNDGSVTNTFVIRGSAARTGSTVRYFSGTTDVSQAMRSSAGWRMSLAPGAHTLVSVQITVGAAAAIGSLKPATVTATWTGDGTRADLAKAVAEVVR